MSPHFRSVDPLLFIVILFRMDLRLPSPSSDRSSSSSQLTVENWMFRTDLGRHARKFPSWLSFLSKDEASGTPFFAATPDRQSVTFIRSPPRSFLHLICLEAITRFPLTNKKIPAGRQRRGSRRLSPRHLRIGYAVDRSPPLISIRDLLLTAETRGLLALSGAATQHPSVQTR